MCTIGVKVNFSLSMILISYFAYVYFFERKCFHDIGIRINIDNILHLSMRNGGLN